MFPVPSHLPRKGVDDIASSPSEIQEVKVDSVLSLFEPLLAQDQTLDSKTVKGVRESLQDAITSNKVSLPSTSWSCLTDGQKTSHELLKTNYPSISSHIRAGSEIIADFASIQRSLADLEGKIDPNSTEVSL